MPQIRAVQYDKTPQRLRGRRLGARPQAATRKALYQVGYWGAHPQAHAAEGRPPRQPSAKRGKAGAPKLTLTIRLPTPGHRTHTKVTAAMDYAVPIQ